jgi:hypothetical protein
MGLRVYPRQPDAVFASNMNVDTLKDKITIDPKPWRDPDYYYSDYDHSYNVSFPVEPSTSYTVMIAAGMQDVYGNSITEPPSAHNRAL